MVYFKNEESCKYLCFDYESRSVDTCVYRVIRVDNVYGFRNFAVEGGMSGNCVVEVCRGGP